MWDIFGLLDVTQQHITLSKMQSLLFLVLLKLFNLTKSHNQMCYSTHSYARFIHWDEMWDRVKSLYKQSSSAQGLLSAPAYQWSQISWDLPLLPCPSHWQVSEWVLVTGDLSLCMAIPSCTLSKNAAVIKHTMPFEWGSKWHHFLYLASAF